MEYLAALGRTHIVLLHLPFGLFAAVIVFEFLTLRPAGAALRPALRILLWVAAAAAAATAATGFVLSREPGYTGPTVERHMWLGIGFAAATLVTAALYEYLHRHARRTAAPAASSFAPAVAFGYRVGLLASVGLLLAAGHFGGTLTHGENFLIEPLLPRTADGRPGGIPAATAPAASASDLFETSIRPIFESNCYACHGPTRTRGKLALHTPAGIRAGGESGPVIVPGNTGASEMIRRLRLPLDDPDHMPPEGKPQPTPQQIAAIESWIAAGAPLPAAPPD